MKEKTTKKVAVKKAVKEEKKGAYSVVLETAGQTLKADVDNVGEFLLNCGVKFTNTATKITVSAGKNKVERVLNTVNARKLFNNPTAAEIFGVQTTKLL